MEPSLFDEVADALRNLAPTELGPIHHQARRYGIKVWFGTGQAPKEHYEAQVIGSAAVDDAKVLALEVGFHAEHPRADDNERIMSRLMKAERRWRPIIGSEAVAGAFLGRQEAWRRVSETWPDPDLSDGELAFEVAARLTDYVTALEPILRAEAADDASAPARRRTRTS